MDRRLFAAGLGVWLGASTAWGQAAQPKPGTPVKAPAADKQTAPSADTPPAPGKGAPRKDAAAGERFKTADELLTGLETADRDLSSLRAQIQYTRDSGSLEGNVEQVRRGTIYYVARLPGAAIDPNGPARRGFAVRFTELIVDGAKRDEPREFVFDGEWIVEKLSAEKQFIKRRIVPPGQVADPLRIGQGPFPIPIGQKRQEIQARFDTTLVSPLEGVGENKPRTRKIIEDDSAYQLKLVPKAGTDEAREFKEIRIWYRGSDLLPRMAQTINRENGHAEVVLIQLARNEAVDPKLFDTTPPRTEDGWQVEVDEFRKPVDDKP
jgi:hypothetical protein